MYELALTPFSVKDTDGYKSNEGVNEDEDQFSDDEFDL